MKYLYKLLIAALFVVSFSACSVTSRYPVMVTDNPQGEKVGKATYRILLGAFILDGGNGSVRKAVEDGEITKISTVDTEVKTKFFITEVTTIVTGE